MEKLKLAKAIHNKRLLVKLFSIAFFVSFLVVLFSSFAYPFDYLQKYGYIGPILSLGLFAMIVLLFYLAFYRLLSRFNDRHIRMISTLIGFIMLGFVTFLIIGFHAVLPPLIDGGHTYAESLYLLAHGHASDTLYFKVYPNNIPITLLRFLLYKFAGLFHISSYMGIDRSFCAIMLGIGIFAGWRLVRDWLDERAACLYLLINLTCLPLFFYTLYFYTDTAIIAFPVLMLYFWHRYAQSRKFRFIMILGVFLGIGQLIRPNLILFLPALAIYMFFVLNWKKVLLNLAIIGVLLAGSSYSFQTVAQQFGYQNDPNLSMPSVHWIMLGLSKDGSYNRSDYDFTRTQPNQAAKKRADWQQIKARLENNPFQGLLRLWMIKAFRTWGEGAHGYDWYTHLSSHPTEAYQYLFNHNKQLTLIIVQVFHIAALVLLLLSACHTFRSKKPALGLLIQITLFGNFLFYTFIWEAEPRYSLLFTPFLLIGAVLGLTELEQLRATVQSATGRKLNVIRLPLIFGLAAAVVVCGASGAGIYLNPKSPQRHYLVDQPFASAKQTVPLDAEHSITQTFHAPTRFNRISMSVASQSGKGSYHFSLVNLRSQQTEYARRFAPDHEHGPITFAFPPIDGNTHFLLKMHQLSGNDNARLELFINGHRHGFEQRDAYPGGALSLNGMKQGRKDLQFSVYEQTPGPFINTFIYVLLMTVPLLMLTAYAAIGSANESQRRKRQNRLVSRSKTQDFNE
ncbi:glycosyltransferase family 39 protein [Sporolactobacillus terrae]|uniref:glycosyltransferase family 39 protein n=1 Tax=Sporolactobacillus terrae TaxID=269673 RepID=UPI0004902F11|nr:glycosyltransferase family 39 protein [Sporolactobacillus terrae]